MLICLVITIGVLSLTYMTISAYQSKLEKTAATDQLTGIYNRHVFDIVLDEMFKEYQRTKKDFSIIMLDIDHFKRINDKFGHLAGDQALKHITASINKNIRKSDVCCRWGGEEFLILLPETDIEEAAIVAESIRSIMEEESFTAGNESIHITMTFGVCRGGEMPVDEVIRRADQAMYRGKHLGRNRVEKCSDQE